MSSSSYQPLNGEGVCLSALDKNELKSYLTTLGEQQLASDRRDFMGFSKPLKAYLCPGHLIGFIPHDDIADDVQIKGAAELTPNLELVGKPMRIVLERFFCQQYPGRGMHRVLIRFRAQCSLRGKKHPVDFIQKAQLQDGCESGLTNCGIFDGIIPDREGIEFECQTINLCSERDEQLLAFLDDPILKHGLHLASATQPLFEPLVQVFRGIGSTFLKQNRNVTVQNFRLGLSFQSTPFGIGLNEGSFIAAQVPEVALKEAFWRDFSVSRKDGVVRRKDGYSRLPFNYLVFNVKRSEL